jgi:hypothetical protein
MNLFFQIFYFQLKLFSICLFLLVLVIPGISFSQQGVAPHPLFSDPVHHGAADPVVVWNKKKKKWWMFYTNRRADMPDSTGVKWVHGTKIGIAESKDGNKWNYVDTADINYTPDAGYTFWAPDIIVSKGVYHMYLTYVPGTFDNWNHPRYIIHLTSKNLVNWKYEARLSLNSEKVIDASVFELPDGSWRLWYNNEKDGKSIYYADSKDLYTWQDKGKAIAARGEGPKVFFWKNTYWMIIDAWKGMEIYRSDDLLHWQKQANRILEAPGKGTDDGAIGGHCDVIVNNGKAYVFYFTHPGRNKSNPAPVKSIEWNRSVIQVAEIEYKNGEITCDRNAPVVIQLKK